MRHVPAKALDSAVPVFFYQNGTFRAETMKETEFDFSPKAGDKVCAKYRKSGDINIKQYDTNRNGNSENEVAYALFLADRDGVELPTRSGSVQYITVKLHDYKFPIKRLFAVHFGAGKSKVTVTIPHSSYDPTLPAIEWVLEETFQLI